MTALPRNSEVSHVPSRFHRREEPLSDLFQLLIEQAERFRARYPERAEALIREAKRERYGDCGEEGEPEDA